MRDLKMVFVGSLLLFLLNQNGQCQDNAVPPQKPAAKVDRKQQPLPKEFAAFAYVPSESALLITARPSAIFKNELIQKIPSIDRMNEESRKLAGADPGNIERITIAYWLDKPYTSPRKKRQHRLPRVDLVFIFHFHKAFDLKKSESIRYQEVTNVTAHGVTYRTGGFDTYFMPDPTTLIIARQDTMESVLANKTPAKVVRSALETGLDHDVTLVAEFESLRPLLKDFAKGDAGQLPGFAELPDHLERLTLKLDFTKTADLNLVIETNSEAAPQTIQKAYNMAYGLIALQLPRLSQEFQRSMGEELGLKTIKLLNQIYTTAKAETDGKQFQFHLQVPASAKEYFQSLGEWQKKRKREFAKKNNLLNIGIAILSYASTRNSMLPFPNGSSELPKAERGKLSWRVHLLPYLDDAALYRKFHLDEAWDSKHNKALLAEMPSYYKLSDQTKPGYTQYVAPAGKGFVVDGDTPRHLRDVTDGLSNTLMVVTVKPDKAVPWTKPGGFDLDPQTAGKILDGYENGNLVLMADGRVHYLDPKLDAKTLKALLTIAGGEPIDAETFNYDLNDPEVAQRAASLREQSERNEVPEAPPIRNARPGIGSSDSPSP